LIIFIIFGKINMREDSTAVKNYANTPDTTLFSADKKRADKKSFVLSLFKSALKLI
jgi:hypothetical protein